MSEMATIRCWYFCSCAYSCSCAIENHLDIFDGNHVTMACIYCVSIVGSEFETALYMFNFNMVG